MKTYRRMLVVGAGLIGASAGLAARRRGIVREVVGYGRSRANLEIALARGAIDAASHDLREAARGADLVLLALPVRAIEKIAADLAAALDEPALVVDAGSVKAPVVAALDGVFASPVRFVGCHPIAGSEQSGAGNAREDLFDGRLCVVTPTDRTDPAALALARELWEALGMDVEEMSAEEHDRMFALVSHLPHVVAWALLGAAESVRVGGRDPLPYAGGSLRDGTRVAGSHPEMWTDIFLDNRAQVLDALEGFEGQLSSLRKLVEAGEAEPLRRELARLREAWTRVGGPRSGS